MENGRIINQEDELYFSADTPPVKIIDFSYKQRDEVLHSHDFYEIVMVKNGSGIHITENKTHPIFHGDIFLIRPGFAHTYEEIKQLEIVNILFTPKALDVDLHDLPKIKGYKEFFEPDFESGYALNLEENQFNLITEIVLEMKHEQNSRHVGYDFFLRLSLLRLIGLICRFYSNSSAPKQNEMTRLLHVLRFMEHRYHEKIQMNELAAIAGMSISSLLREFHNEMGESPINYLINLRLEKAAWQLRNTGKRITEISWATGFQDSNYFSKMFKKKYIASPREYRKNHP